MRRAVIKRSTGCGFARRVLVQVREHEEVSGEHLLGRTCEVFKERVKRSLFSF
jgi:predicted GNAT superfamily acetyltransferase